MDPHTLSGQHPGFQGLRSSQTHSDPQIEVVQKLHPDTLQNRQTLKVFAMVKVTSIPYFRLYFRDWLQKLDQCSVVAVARLGPSPPHCHQQLLLQAASSPHNI